MHVSLPITQRYQTYNTESENNLYCKIDVSNREWECDTLVPKDKREMVKDIARQLIEDMPGSR